MIFNKNRVSFHLLWKENLVKHQKVSKYYDHLQNFLLLFRSLLTAQIAKTVIFWVEFTLFFSKDVLDQTWTSFKFRPQWKDRKSSYQVRPILTLFCNLFPLILGWKCVEDQEIIKIVKQIRGSVTSQRRRLVCRDNHSQIFDTSSSFHLKYSTTGKVSFLFSSILLLVLTKFLV